ncbi:putative E3 ubiquitin-protein ligase UBR7 [Brachionichthys hirsutus]|uniref:putative E3 ubiquitin-protein ligase UBR7 n=1 Tax=Brachionichthys hirsutus TaxID=412623 RepID=UPI0036052511
MAAGGDEAGCGTDAEALREALCVLAGSDPENCSYPQGYVKRQAVFACNTCTPNAAEPAGVCLACANNCHDGHDIFELYTKRHFCCDCGNNKFGDFKCQLIPDKDDENVRNRYNHNFSGCYCTCDRPYPDTDDQANEEMIQCVVCEDWLHSRHLGCTVVEPEELQEMVCEACMNKAPFLWTYAAHFAVPPVIGPPQEGEEVNDEENSEQICGTASPSTSAEQTKKEMENKRSPCKRPRVEMTGSPSQTTLEKVSCRLRELQVQCPETPRRGAVFWPYSWRSELCTCMSCKKAYVAADVQFLMDQSDTILAYENKGLAEPFGQHPLMALINSMERVQQLEVIYGLKELTTSIAEFSDQTGAEGKMVTDEAVNQFFEDLRAGKRRKANAEYQ